MSAKRLFLITSIIAFTLGLCISQGTAKTKVLQIGEDSILDPGKLLVCPSDFIVENSNNDASSLKVVLGNKVYISEMVNPGEKLAYNLPAIISTARFHGQEELTSDESAVIINLGPVSKLQISCLQLKKNPLKREDPLSTFK